MWQEKHEGYLNHKHKGCLKTVHTKGDFATVEQELEAVAQADVFHSLLNKIAKLMKLSVDIELLKGYWLLCQR